MIQVTGLTKRYGRLTALDNVSFSIRPGEILGLIGPNGSGKTTLFECLGGVLPLDAGSVVADEELFYLPDGIAPWPAQTVRWALQFVGEFFYAARDRDTTTRYLTPDLIAELGLAPFLDSAIGTLSKGQRKRALMAIGLLMPHPVLLADEPFDGLDLRQTRALEATLRTHAAGGRTLFLSIHQIADAARVCDRFVLLSNGRVCGEGTLEELSARAGKSGDLEEVFLALT